MRKINVDINFDDQFPSNYIKLAEGHIQEYLDFLNHQKEIKKSWHTFISTGKLTNDNCIRPEVLSSWKRSKERGIDPTKANPLILTKKELEFRLEQNKELLELVSPILNALILNLRDSGFRVDFIDKDLFILKQFGEPSVIKDAKKQGSYPGVNKSERIVGTSAINLAATLGTPVQLVGAEHYNVQLHYWTCSATPLFDTKGNLLGVVNVAGHCLKYHKHTFGMVIALGKAIEYSLFQKSLREEKDLANNYTKSIVDSMSEGLIALNPTGDITVINRAAGDVLGLKENEAIGKPIEALLENGSDIRNVLKQGKPYFNKELNFKINKNKSKLVIGNVVPIVNRDKVNGMLAIFKELGEVRNFVRKVAGFKAYFNFDDLKGSGSNFKQVVNLAKQAAVLSSNILILGESGTGKEMFAQAIHNTSNNKAGPFVGINCAAIPADLIESELFGYEGGAFTGAKRDGQPGKFQLAASGTIFLDEVNSMPMNMQVKLLRVLQNRNFTRVGGVTEIPLEARIIAAANSDLWEEVRLNHFREDLYYRLNVITLKIPPLRERNEDIVEFIYYFCRKNSERLKVDFSITKKAQELLTSYHWPGNVRELENAIERCTVLAYSRNSNIIEETDVLNHSGIKRSLDLQEAPINSESKKFKLGNLESLESHAIEKALQETENNISKAAELLGITRKTLYKKIEKYGLKH